MTVLESEIDVKLLGHMGLIVQEQKRRVNLKLSSHGLNDISQSLVYFGKSF